MRKEQSFGPKSDFGPKPRFRSQIVTKSTFMTVRFVLGQLNFAERKEERSEERASVPASAF